jgi:radical SAM superfamily enzyme YgiQ (UPF0313 family)
MKIAFLSLNRENLPDPVVPIGLLYVMANTPPEHPRELWDLAWQSDPVAFTRERIASFQPDLIAVGMRNIQNNDYTGYHTNLDYYQQVFATIRAATTAPIVLGGGGFSVMPRELMLHLKPDYGISGEGERAFAQLVNVLARGEGALDQIGNLHYFRQPQRGPQRSLLVSARADELELVSVPTQEGFQDLDALVRPDRAVVDARYYSQVGIDSVQTKRGCPLRCDYCTYPLIEGKSIRQRDPVQVVDEMFEAVAKQPSISHFFIVDSVFNLPPKHAKDICRELIRRNWKTPWTCYANPIGYDEELAQLMREAGCAGMEVGSDSGVDEILVRLKKGFKTDRIRTLHQHAAAAGVPDCHTFILGTPGETLDHVRATLDFCTELDPYAAIMMIWMDDYEALDADLAARRRVFREEIKALMAEKKEEFPRWIIPPLAVNFDDTLFGFLRRTGRTGPLWQHVTLVGSDRRSRRLKRLVAAKRQESALAD